MRSLVWVHAKEATFIFCRINWETTFQEPFFEGKIESFLDKYARLLLVKEISED